MNQELQASLQDKIEKFRIKQFQINKTQKSTVSTLKYLELFSSYCQKYPIIRGTKIALSIFRSALAWIFLTITRVKLKIFDRFWAHFKAEIPGFVSEVLKIDSFFSLLDEAIWSLRLKKCQAYSNFDDTSIFKFNSIH